MKHPLGKLSRRNRNIITGILIGLASLVLVAVYLDIPMGEFSKVLLAISLLLLAIMLAAILFVAAIKGISRLFGGHDRDEPGA